MDSTAGVAPFRLLTSPLRDKSALLVPAEGAGKIVTTPQDPPFLSTQRVEIDGQVSDLGKLTATVHYSLRGDTEFVMRRAFHTTPPDQWKQLGETILSLDGVHGNVISVKPGDPTDTHAPFEIEIEFAQAKFPRLVRRACQNRAADAHTGHARFAGEKYAADRNRQPA